MSTTNQNNSKFETVKAERSRTRWMMVFYDTLFYVICGFLLLVLQPSMIRRIPAPTVFLYWSVGYVFFFGFRFLLKSYRRILRYGSIYAFSRELLAGISASSSLLLFGFILSRVFYVARISLVLLLSFASIYVVVSVVIRILYCYLYRFASKDDNVISRGLRRFIELFAFVDFTSKKPGACLRLVLEPDVRSHSPINEIQRIVDQFAIRGEVTSITQINKGYINRTYKVETLSDRGHVHRYTLQRINNSVFPDVDALMKNFKTTTDHLYGKFLLPGHRGKGSVQTLRPTKDGCSYLLDSSGYWRILTYFDKVYSLNIPDSPETFYQAGLAFGRFLKEMSDVEVDQIAEVIPNFHNTKSRYLDLEEAAKKNPKGRLKNVMPEMKFIRARADRFGMISDALDSGRIPKRICHNDCNLNNILFDNKTHLPVAIIDLDTVMPSSPLYDFGDSMRIGTNTATDDEKDLSKVSCDLALYERYAKGYLEACGDILTEEELSLLPYAALIITAEDGIRFLADHINGDTYYNIYYPGQNLDRARTQLKLLEDMEKKLPEIKDILRNIYSDLNLKAKID